MLSGELELLSSVTVRDQVQNELNDGPKAKSKCYQGETKDSDNKGKNISDFAAIGRL